MKYIIKNCPATFQNIDDEYVCPSVCRQEGFPIYCENTTNCLLKRIVELCKKDKEPIIFLKNKGGSVYFDDDGKLQEADSITAMYSQDKHLADCILKHLEIEEVE